jgi:hypothetical protein
MGLSGRAEKKQNQTAMFEASRHRRAALAALLAGVFRGPSVCARFAEGDTERPGEIAADGD